MSSLDIILKLIETGEKMPHSNAGKKVQKKDLVNIEELIDAYFAIKPEKQNDHQKVSYHQHLSPTSKSAYKLFSLSFDWYSDWSLLWMYAFEHEIIHFKFLTVSTLGN